MPNWMTSDSLADIAPQPNHQAWLLERGSLTLRLKKHCPELKVNILQEGLSTPLADEAKRLGMADNHQAWLRCVKIKCQDKGLIYARTVIPQFDQHNPWYQIQQLGDQPLGEILFTRTDLHRSEFEFCHADHWPHLQGDYLARCCIFEQNTAPLLLTEVFLDFL